MKPTHNLEESTKTRAVKRKHTIPAEKVNEANCISGQQPTTNSPDSNGSVLNELKRVTSELSELKHSVQYMSEKYDELLTAIKAEKEENKQLRDEMAQLIENNDSLQSRFNAIETDWNNDKQNKIRNNVVVFGFSDQAQNSQELNDTVNKIIQKVNIEEENALTDWYQRRSNNNHAGAIVLKFKNNNTKNTFIKIAKRLDINTADIGLCSRKSNKMRLSEQLTPMNQQILNEARQLRTHGFKFIWTKNGRIMARKSPNSDILVIPNFDYIDSLKSINQTI